MKSENENMDKKTIIISAINFSEGGPLTIYKECLKNLEENFLEEYRIVALVHNRNLFSEYESKIEFIEFNKNNKKFLERNAMLIGASTDTEYVHLGWRENHPQLAELSIPMLADTSKSLAEEMGILNCEEKVAYRATFIIDPQGIIQWVSVYPMNVGRNVDEVLRVLDALQTEELTACGWKAGEQTLSQQLKK